MLFAATLLLCLFPFLIVASALAGRSIADAVARHAGLNKQAAADVSHLFASSATTSNARIALHQANRPRAQEELTRAQRLRPALTYALPHLAAQARIELAKCHLALADFTATRTLLREVDDVLRRRPGLGVFARQAEDLRAQLSHARGSSAPGASALTAAELRLLPILATRLSFPEIAAEMFLSRNTIKSEANAIYRKLGVSTRSQAVARSRELGLLEG